MADAEAAAVPLEVDEAPPADRDSPTSIFARFLKFGALAWGGPAAQIAMIKHECVDEVQWVSQETFRKTLAVYQVLPGPEAHELCVYFGRIRGAAFSHRGGGCTFETMLASYELDDPALRDIARIVHEADLNDERFDAPEARGLDVILRGLSMITESDEEMLALSGPIYDGLYEYRRRATMLGREPG